MLYSKSSSPGAAAFWSLKSLQLQGHLSAASGDNQAARQKPALLYVSLFNDKGLILCYRGLDTSTTAEVDSLQVLKLATETAELKLQTNVTKATGPPDQLQKGVLLGWYYAADKDYYFAEHLRTEQELENKSSWRFLDAEAGKEHNNRAAEQPRHLTWREAADLNEDREHKERYNSWFVVCAAPSEPAFEAQMRLQRYLPPPLTLGEKAAVEARALRKRQRESSRPSSVAGVEQPDARSFLALCTGTGILPGMLALRGYSGEMVDSAKDGALFWRNWWHLNRPADALQSDGLERLSADLRQQGVGESGSSGRVELRQLDTAELQVNPNPVDLVSPRVQKLPLALGFCSAWLGPTAGLLPHLAVCHA